MANLNLDAKKLEGTYGVLREVAYGNIKEMLDSLAAVVMPIADTSELATELLEDCRTATSAYNDQYLPGLQATIGEFEKVFDVAEYLATKASTGSVAKVDASFKTQAVDADAVRF